MTTRGHAYRVTVLPLQEQEAAPQRPHAIEFTHRNHDDLHLIVERMRLSTGLDPEAAAAAAIGVKLLGSVMLAEKNNPLFDCLRAPLREFITKLKSPAPPADPA